MANQNNEKSKYEFPTIRNSRLEDFPFKEGERVLIRWTRYPPEEATIVKLFVSRQWDTDVVYAVSVKTESREESFCINHTILEKLTG